jgi:hypothetical protein
MLLAAKLASTKLRKLGLNSRLGRNAPKLGQLA